MKTFLVRWQEEVWVDALTPAAAAKEIADLLLEVFTEEENGRPTEFTVIGKDDDHLTVVKVGADG